jgi:hypothetical protein
LQGRLFDKLTVNTVSRNEIIFVSIGTYGVIDALNVLEAQNRSFQVEKLQYKRSSERRIVTGGFLVLIGITLALIYTWLLIKEFIAEPEP